jgi:protein-S-isoprenylcysteine O-methyltransferase Ste14
MEPNTSTGQIGNRGSSKTNLVLKVLIQAVVLLPILATLFFIPVGHFDWVMGWVLLGVYLVSLFVSSLLVILRDPSLARERSGVPESAEVRDKRLINLYNVLIYLVMLPLAGFDERFKWSSRVHLAVVSGGPYQYVRHPGYVGMIAMFLGAPLALGSLRAVIPAVCAAAVVVVRTVLEERALIERLDGYPDYAQQVRRRFLPGIW